jgi:monoamine oxidase
MTKTDIIVIGAGAAGLVCARDLALAGNKVTILEARDRLGGRIHTINDTNFPLPVEAGAEFVHGNLSITKQLLKQAGLDYYEMEGDLWRSEKGQFIEQDDFIEDLDMVIKKLKELETDTNVASFMDSFFYEEKYLMLRKTLKNYVEGYDAADTTRASAFALLQELLGEDNDQFRIQGGYQKLVEYLANTCTSAGCSFRLETIVKEIRWQKGNIKVLDQNGNIFPAAKIVISVPFGILQSSPEAIEHITFLPAIHQVQNAIQSLGYGAAIKMIVHFKEPIWNNQLKSTPKKSAPSFVFSDARIPTWWTQMPLRNGMITGWIAGPKAVAIMNESEDSILEMGLKSLSQIFRIPFKIIQSMLISSHVHNWSADNFAKGAYTYETVYSKNAKRIIIEGVEDTLFFAGEALHEGPESGTVEAALSSGMKTAEKIIAK